MLVGSQQLCQTLVCLSNALGASHYSSREHPDRAPNFPDPDRVELPDPVRKPNPVRELLGPSRELLANRGPPGSSAIALSGVRELTEASECSGTSGRLPKTSQARWKWGRVRSGSGATFRCYDPRHNLRQREAQGGPHRQNQPQAQDTNMQFACPFPGASGPGPELLD